MSNNRPRRISFPEVRALAESLRNKNITLPYLSNGIGMLKASVTTLLSMIKIDTPYIIEEPRFGLIRNGKGRVLLNMIEQEVTTNTFIYMGKGSIMQPISFTPDIEVYALMVDNERLSDAIENALKDSLNSTALCFAIEATHEEAELAEQMFEIIWALIHKKNYPNNTLNSLIQSLIHYYIFINERNELASTNVKPRNREMFEQFISLLNAHCKEQHSLSFYADKMCVTPRYLGVVVKETSGVTAKEWIDRAVMTSAKVMLRHTDKQVVEIADDLNFPNPSFFCKFFKRMAGVTPQNYRQKQ